MQRRELVHLERGLSCVRKRFTTSLYKQCMVSYTFYPTFQYFYTDISTISTCEKRISRGGPTCETLRSLTMFDFLHFQYLYIFVYLRKRISRGGLLVKPCDPARFLFSSLDLLARSKEIWMSSALSTRKTWRPSPLVVNVIQIHTIISAPEIEYCKGK